jgi:hypothetical protein
MYFNATTVQKQDLRFNFTNTINNLCMHVVQKVHEIDEVTIIYLHVISQEIMNGFQLSLVLGVYNKIYQSSFIL